MKPLVGSFNTYGSECSKMAYLPDGKEHHQPSLKNVILACKMLGFELK